MVSFLPGFFHTELDRKNRSQRTKALALIAKKEVMATHQAQGSFVSTRDLHDIVSSFISPVTKKTYFNRKSAQ